MKRFIISIVVALAVIILIMLLVPQFLKGKIEKIIREEANKAVVTSVDFNDVTISLFRNFPNVFVGINEIVVTGMSEADDDTLMNVETLAVSMNVLDFFSGDYRIRRIDIERPELYLKVDDEGNANWDILSPEDTTAAETGGEDSYRLVLDKVKASDGLVVYQDEEIDTYLRLMQFGLVLSGDLTADRTLLETETHVGSAWFEYGQLPYFTDAVIDLTADINADMKNGIYHLQDNQLSINDVVLKFEGSVGDEGGGVYNLMLNFDTPKNTFKSFLSLVPAIYSRDFEAMEASGDFAMDGFIKGIYSEEVLPSFEVNINATGGRLQYPDLPAAVENIFVTGKISNQGTATNDIEIDLSRISFTALQNSFDARLFMKNLVVDPFIELSVDADLNLADVGKVYPLEEGDEMVGTADADIMISGYMSAIENERYDEFRATGTVYAENLEYATTYLPDPLEVRVLQLNLAPAYIDLVNFSAVTGGNDMRLKGKVENYLSYALKDGELKGNFLFTSDGLNLNELLQSEEGAGETPDTVELTVYQIPEKIHFILNAEIAEMQYADIMMKDVKGKLEIEDQKLMITDLRSSLFDGQLVLNGKYDTWDPGSPMVDLSLQINNVSIPRVANTFYLFEQYAPFAKTVDGRMNAKLDFRSLLNNNMLPVLTTITGNGRLSTTEVEVEGVNSLSMIADRIGISELSKFKAGPIDLSFQVNDGILNVKPFSFEVLSMDMELSGWTSFDREIGYELDLGIPTSIMGGELNDKISGLLSQAGPIADELKLADVIPVTALIGGSLDNPEISLSIADAADDLIKNLKEKAMEELEKKKEEVIGQVKEEAERILAEGERRAQEVIDEAQKRADQVMAAAKDMADKTRKEADQQAAKLEEEGSEKGMIAAAAAKTAASKLRDEGEKQAQNIVDEAQKKADQIMAAAREQAEKIRKEASDRAGQL